MKDFFPTMVLKPNSTCVNPDCCRLQIAHQAKLASPEYRNEDELHEADEQPLHEDNEWGIEVSCTDPAVATNPSTNMASADALPDGLHYELPNRDMVDEGALGNEGIQMSSASLDDLTSMLHSLNAASQ